MNQSNHQSGNQSHTGFGVATTTTMAKEAIYRSLIDASREELRRRPRPARDEAMTKVVALLWRAYGGRPISWVGFYERVTGTDEMVLLAREPKPACSPIGLHGMCGRSLIARRPMVVRDVAVLGEGYIACDPADKSELVVPLIDDDGACLAVLDVDSYEVGAFDANDVEGCTALLTVWGLTRPSKEERELVVL